MLLTDGEDQESFPIEAAKRAADRGVKIFTVGLGDSAEGARIPVRDSSGNVQYIKEEGKEHWSKADQGVLRQIALTTGGAHIPPARSPTISARFTKSTWPASPAAPTARTRNANSTTSNIRYSWPWA